MGNVSDALQQKLNDAFAPVRLEIQDDSEKHRGHSGARPGGETHFSVHLVSERFVGLNKVARHRLVNQVLADELAGPVHALSLALLAPDEG